MNEAMFTLAYCFVVSFPNPKPTQYRLLSDKQSGNVTKYLYEKHFVFLYFLGNFMYFAATSEYMVLGSRFVVGELIIFSRYM